MKHKILTVGHACLDIVHDVSNLPRLDCKMPSQSIDIRIGGNAANAASAIADFGAQASLCTVLGSHSHPFTRVLITLLIQQGIDTRWCEMREDLDCSCSTILVTPDGKRTLVNFQNDQMKNAISIPSDITQYQFVMGDNYRLPMVSKVFNLASSAGIRTMLDLDDSIEDLSSIPSCDFAWLSRETFAKLNVSLEEIQKFTKGFVGVTNGEYPVIYKHKNGLEGSYQPLPARVKNTLGAGDVFRARFAIEMSNFTNIETAISLASNSAIQHIEGKSLYKI